MHKATQLIILKMPILIYGGRYGYVEVPRMIVKYKLYCQQAEFVMLEHSLHNLQVEEHCKLLALIREFLKK